MLVAWSIHPVLAARAEPVPGPGAMFPALVYGRVGPGAAAPSLLLPSPLHLAVRARAGGPLLSMLLPLFPVLGPAGTPLPPPSALLLQVRPLLSLRRAGMAGWTAGGWLAEDPRHSCRLLHLVMGKLQLLHHLLQILLVHLFPFSFDRDR